MARQYGTNSKGGPFDDATIAAVWAKALRISGESDTLARKDICGARIRMSLYGRTVDQGWEIDHIEPVSNGGSDHLSNLQPLQWENNRAKSDLPAGNWSCKVKS